MGKELPKYFLNFGYHPGGSTLPSDVSCEEVQRTLSSLSRHVPMNVLLLGDVSVAQNVVCAGVVKALKEERVPSSLDGRELVVLNHSAVVEDISASNISDVEMVRGLGDVSKFIIVNRLSNLLYFGGVSRFFRYYQGTGQIRSIAIASTEEYDGFVGKYAEVVGKMEVVPVPPLTKDDVLTLIKSEIDAYAEHHLAVYSHEVLARAIDLCCRHFGTNGVYSKLQVVIDEAGSRLRVQAHDTESPAVVELRDKIAQLRKEKDRVVRAKRFEEAARMRDREKDLIEEIEATKREEEVVQVTTEIVDEVVSDMVGRAVS